jgi:peptidyl-dipeptidase Dcp
MSVENPLFNPFQGINDSIPFDQIKTEHYKPAIKEALERARLEIKSIETNPDQPTFSNTIEALEYSGQLLDDIFKIFHNLTRSHTNDELDKLNLELSPKITEFTNDIYLNPILFLRVKSVNESAQDLNPEQKMLLEQTYKNFKRQGAELNDDDKQTFREILVELSKLEIQYDQNVLKGSNAYILHLTDSNQLDGLPDSLVEIAVSEAKSRNLDGWVITLDFSCFFPFIQYSKNRQLRETLFRAYNSVSYKGEFDNTEIVKSIVNLRLKKAQILGYQNYADFALEDRMALNTKTVDSFLLQLQGRSLDAAKKDVHNIKEFAKKSGFEFELMPWDFYYFSEKLKEDLYKLNNAMTKPYFLLENVQNGIFLLAEKLYGLSFKENNQMLVYHPDVNSYEVYDKDGSFLAILYIDYFPRKSKKSGAWAGRFRFQHMKNGIEIRPIGSIHFNFPKSSEKFPSLLTFDDVQAFLHEFGHYLHLILSKVTYPSLSGYSVKWDFVELPSQLMENWANEKEFLDLWAVHYQTGEKIPNDLVQKIVDSKNFLSGFYHVGQVKYGLIDLSWHKILDPFEGDVREFEVSSSKSVQILPLITETCISTHLSHIISGGYAAGYYSYKWAEVLEADAFSLFKEKGIFNHEVAQSFRDNILSKGGSENPSTLFVQFRGREPNPEALFDKLGIK